MPLFARQPKTETVADGPEPSPSRRLFLDDDPARSEIFLADFPDAVWVQTAAECIARLAEPWDEVHLDHDLGGEHFVDVSRPDCGMEVVRWLCVEPRPHLRAAKFLVHSHNPNAATMMGMQLMLAGFTVEVRPFGSPPPPPTTEEPPPRLSPLAILRRLYRRIVHGESFDAQDYGYTSYDRLASHENTEADPLWPPFGPHS